MEMGIEKFLIDTSDVSYCTYSVLNDTSTYNCKAYYLCRLHAVTDVSFIEGTAWSAWEGTTMATIRATLCYLDGSSVVGNTYEPRMPVAIDSYFFDSAAYHDCA